MGCTDVKYNGIWAQCKRLAGMTRRCPRQPERCLDLKETFPSVKRTPPRQSFAMRIVTDSLDPYIAWGIKESTWFVTGGSVVSS